jgi:hypothetical protein
LRDDKPPLADARGSGIAGGDRSSGWPTTSKMAWAPGRALTAISLRRTC